MSSKIQFKREGRYISLKLSHLSESQKDRVYSVISEQGIQSVDCVVVEADWPEYERVWQMIEKRVSLESMTPAEKSAEGCTCVRYGEYSPHWPCPIHSSAIAAPPELAELQATIANLREGIAEHWKVVCDQRAELEQLKGGQGEPVAYLVTDIYGQKKALRVGAEGIERHRKSGSTLIPLFAGILLNSHSEEGWYTDECDNLKHRSEDEQPAPVSVVLPERKHPRPDGDNTLASTYNINLGWNACLDKVKELNYQGHASDCSTNNRGVPELLGPCDCHLSKKSP